MKKDRKKKGMNLTMSTVVIFVACVIVLLALVVWFTNTTESGRESTNCNLEFSSACAKFHSMGGCEDGSVSDDVGSAEKKECFGELVDMNCYSSKETAAEACCRG